MEERLQNILSHRGVASRRGAAAMIEEGRVTVNGAVVREPGARFDPAAAEIAVDGAPIGAAALTSQAGGCTDSGTPQPLISSA